MDKTLKTNIFQCKLNVWLTRLKNFFKFRPYNTLFHKTWLSILLGHYENKKHLMPPVYIFYDGRCADRSLNIHVYYIWLSVNVFTILHNMLGCWVLRLQFWLRGSENWTRSSWQPSPSGILLAAWRPYWHRLWLSSLFFHL